jgi:XTP/dITP diphosphohydrolase
MKEIVFATNNKHKLEEVNAMLGDHFLLKSLDDIGCTVDIPETGDTFEINASQKSHYIKEHYQLDCFADDSGLMVEALNNEPGVLSARYSGSRDMKKNIELLLNNLKGKNNRKAAFITVISLLAGDQEHFFEGRIEGSISTEIMGDNGFGYDPIFIPAGYSKSFAQMDAAEKNNISHRAIAVQKLVKFLQADQAQL